MEQVLTRMPQLMAMHKDNSQATAASPELGYKLG
jgi:hypothetical protein